MAKASILLVDDRPANLLSLEALLEDLDQHLITAGSGEEALRRLELDEEEVAVVLLDVQMEGLDGFETARLIRGRKKTRNMPIIFLTAYEDDRLSAEKAYKLGAVDYIHKPIVPQILRAKVAWFVELFSEKQERRKAEDSLRKAQAELEIRVQQRTAELALANEALKEADRRKDDFLAMLAHELRNPLAPVRNALQIMKMPDLSADALRRARDMMERQIQHLVRVVDDLLDMSRIMRGMIELRKEHVDLSTLFARAAETAQPTVEAQGQELSVCVPSQPVWVEGDLVRLVQVIGNLLVNAAKYTDRSGRIWLTGERDGETAVIRVRDSGVGIDPQLVPRIFDLFVQADRSLARSKGGLGIGLTLVRRLVEMHGGSVSATSAGIGQGSEFVVRLPALPEGFAEEPGDSSGEEPLRAAASPRRVLVVDDNVDAAESSAMLLRFLGHEAEVAHNGHAALDAVREFRPEIVLLDIGLPGMNGYDVARALRALPEYKGLVLAAVTGYGQEDDRRRSREAGFDYHLTKPLAPNTLRAFVASPQSSALSRPERTLAEL
jgi:signal transduction histidine kinase